MRKSVRLLSLCLASAGFLAGPSADADLQWSAAGSTGAVDEDSTNLVARGPFALSFRGAAAGRIQVRYLVPRLGDDQGNAVFGATLWLTFQRAGASDRIIAVLKKMNGATGAVSSVLTLDSNDYAALPGAQQQCIAGGDETTFDFNSLYVLDVTLARSGTAGSSPALFGFMLDGSGCK